MGRIPVIDAGRFEVGEELPPRVTDVEVRPDYVLRLAFSNGEVRDFDVKPLLDRGVFQPLRDAERFEDVFIDGDAVAWPGGPDISAARLFHDSRYVGQAPLLGVPAVGSADDPASAHPVKPSPSPRKEESKSTSVRAARSSAPEKTTGELKKRGKTMGVRPHARKKASGEKTSKEGKE